MAAISFPTAPTEGQTYSFGGTTYAYESANNRWLSEAAGGATVVVSQTRPDPTMGSAGDLWWYCGADGEDPGLFTLVEDSSGDPTADPPVPGQFQWIQSSPGITFESSSTGETGVTPPETAADFEIARNFTFPTSSHSGTTTNAGSGEIDWNIAGTETVQAYIGMGMSESRTFIPPFVYAAGDWVHTSNSLTTTFSHHVSRFIITLNGIQVADQTQTGAGTTTGGGYITQAMIDAGDGNPDNDTWMYNLTDAGGSSSANGSVIIYADSRL